MKSVIEQVQQRPELFYASQTWYRDEPFAIDRDTRTAILVGQYVQLRDLGTIPWQDHYVWTGDTDTEGNRVYIGRVEQYGGLQIHRHLANPDIRDP